MLMNNNVFVPLTSSNHSMCDICKKSDIKVHRRYKDKAYCVNCYKQFFKKRPCVSCGDQYRFHLDETKLICPTCMRHQPCIRCGKDAVKNGTNTIYGRVCQVCNQNYFKPKKVCFECGEEKSNISRYKNIPHDEAVCENCYHKYTHNTCPCCKRYRKLIDTANGKMCQKCHNQGQIPCPSCHNTMWAGVGERCWDCYWSSKISHEVKLNQHIFETQSMKDSYADFVEWFGRNKGLVKANIKHNDFIDFFVRCDGLWGKIPSYEILVKEFKPEGLRHNLTVLRWLVDTQQIVIDENIKNQVAEESRIKQLLAKLGVETPLIIRNYYEYLLARQIQKGTALKTVRLSLQPVVDIYYQYQLINDSMPSQAQLDGYLKQKSGQLNNLSSFIVFLKEQHQANLTAKPPSKKLIAKIKRKDAENELMALAKSPLPLSDENQLKWLQMSLVYFHSISLDIQAIRKSQVSYVDSTNMLAVCYKGKKYHVPRLIDNTN